MMPSSSANYAITGRLPDGDAAKIPPSLAKQCLQLHHPKQKFSNDAVELSSEFLKLFVVEARRRAAIEVSVGIVYFDSGYRFEESSFYLSFGK